MMLPAENKLELIFMSAHLSFFSVFIYNLLANHVSHSLFVWYKPIYKWTWNLPDSLKYTKVITRLELTYFRLLLSLPVSSTGFIIFKFWRQTNDVMTASFVSIQSLDLCGYKMRTLLGLEPRPPITASRQPLKPGCALPLSYEAPSREQVGTHIYIRTSQVFPCLFITCLQTM